MHVIVRVSAWYNWQPVPADVRVTPSDLSSGRVKPGANGGYDMRVRRNTPSETKVTLSEGAILERLVYELIPRAGLRKLLRPCSRKELVAEILDQQVMPQWAEPEHFTGFQVECDDGPDEKAARAKLAAYVEAKHAITGEPLIAPDRVESIIAKYLEPATPDDHVDHLHARFGVKRAS